MYKPLFIDHAVEGKRGGRIARRIRPLLLAIRKRTRLRCVYDVPAGRASVEIQLSQRPIFPMPAWVDRGCKPECVERCLVIVAQELCWPNHHFMPEDPMELALIVDYDEFAVEFLVNRLDVAFDVSLTPRSIRVIPSVYGLAAEVCMNGD